MVDTIFPANAVGGAPEYSGRMLRQAGSAAFAGATATRPLGARSGVRPGTPVTTVTSTATTWTCGPFAGVADAEAAAEAGPYTFAFDAATSGAVTAADASNPRVDIVYVQIDDPSESDGSTVPAATRLYLAGTAAASPVAPTTPARSFVVARINVPVVGGGSPTVTWAAPYTVAAGGILPVASSAEYPANPVKGVYVDDAALGGLVRYTGSVWTPVATDTGWVTIPPVAPYTGSGQVRRIGKRVTLRGQFDRASGDIAAETVGTLPVGFRPTGGVVTGVGLGSSATYAKLVLNTSGTVVIAAAAGGTSTYIRVDNISFLLD